MWRSQLQIIVELRWIWTLIIIQSIANTKLFVPQPKQWDIELTGGLNTVSSLCGRCKEWRHTNSLDEYNCLRLCTVWCLLVWMEIDVRPEMIITQWDSNRWQKQIRWALINCYKYPHRQRQSKLVNLEARRDRESAVKLCTFHFGGNVFFTFPFLLLSIPGHFMCKATSSLN